MLHPQGQKPESAREGDTTERRDYLTLKTNQLMKQIDESTVTIPLSRYNEIVKIDEFLNKGMSAGRRQTFRTEFLSKDEHLNVVTKERIEIEEAFIELINEKARLEEDVLNQIRSKSIFELIKIKLT